MSIARPIAAAAFLLCLSGGGAQTVCQEKEDRDWREVFRDDYELPRDYGHDWKLASMFAITPEDGLLLGGGAILYEYAFRRMPYNYRLELAAGVTIPTGRFKVLATGLWPSVTRTMQFGFLARFSELEVRNYYGPGNESPRDAALEESDYYRVSTTDIALEPTVAWWLRRDVLRVGGGLSYRYFDVREKPERLVSKDSLRALGYPKVYVGGGVGMLWDTRDHPAHPHGGFMALVSGWAYADPFKDSGPFQRLSGDFRAYWGDTLGLDVSLALRVAGEKLYGGFPFFESAFLGGASSLRGYPQQRYAGDASVHASIDLRVAFFRPKVIIPVEVGGILLADAGRVWLEGDSPGGLHTDAGGGIWLAPMNRDLILSFVLASSVDGLFLNAQAGFNF